jgi:hypothetical protein
MMVVMIDGRPYPRNRPLDLRTLGPGYRPRRQVVLAGHTVIVDRHGPVDLAAIEAEVEWRHAQPEWPAADDRPRQFPCGCYVEADGVRSADRRSR